MMDKAAATSLLGDYPLKQEGSPLLQERGAGSEAWQKRQKSLILAQILYADRREGEKL